MTLQVVEDSVDCQLAGRYLAKTFNLKWFLSKAVLGSLQEIGLSDPQFEGEKDDPEKVRFTNCLVGFGNESVFVETCRFDDDSIYLRGRVKTEALIKVKQLIEQNLSKVLGKPNLLPGAHRYDEFGTECKIDLGLKLEGLVSSKFNGFLQDYWAKYVLRPFPENFARKLLAEVHLTRITASAVVVPSTVSDPETLGARGVKHFTLEASSPQEREKNVYKTFSELPYDLHLEMVENMIENAVS